MTSDIEVFNQEFFQDVYNSAYAEGQFIEDTFFDQFCDRLVQAGELDTADRVQYLSPRGLRIDGYGGDPELAGGILTLILVDFQTSQQCTTLTATQMNAIFKRGTNFLAKSLSPAFRNRLEESTPAFGLADLIAARWKHTIKVRFLLVSNRILSSRVDGRDAEDIEGTPVTFGVWDLSRLHRFVVAGRGHEDIEIDLEDFGGGLPALRTHLTNADYEAYLIVIPGTQLASFYDRWGVRLLEQNVRVFLQARGKVNKGIRITLEHEPEMFFAYNNGITATAESVKTKKTPTGLIITYLKNLQIVNGGQTTASIYAASKTSTNSLKNVFVQMKLSLVEPEKALEIVPKISEFANSQNRVNAADFFANHPFHVRIEGFSRRIYAPSPDGTFHHSKWFYERARGQYQDARAHLTPAKRRKFDVEYPRRQMFTKTDMAKFLMLWYLEPDTVSKGAQKNFAAFAAQIGKEWSQNKDVFNERYYFHTISKAIIFRAVEKVVTEQPWYEGGYRANIVAYAISKLAHDTARRKCTVDFDTIWKTQTLTPALETAFVLSAHASNDVLVAPSAGVRNVTEWAKKQQCWDKMKKLVIDWPQTWLDEQIPLAAERDAKEDAVKDQRVLTGIESQTAVIGAGGDFWREVVEWGTVREFLSPKERGILEVSASFPSKLPSEKQCVVSLEVLARLQAEGCPFTLDDS